MNFIDECIEKAANDGGWECTKRYDSGRVAYIKGDNQLFINMREQIYCVMSKPYGPESIRAAAIFNLHLRQIIKAKGTGVLDKLFKKIPDIANPETDLEEVIKDIFAEASRIEPV